MDLSTKPYRALHYHTAALRSVAYHPTYPLFASASDDATIHVFHGMVYQVISGPSHPALISKTGNSHAKRHAGSLLRLALATPIYLQEDAYTTCAGELMSIDCRYQLSTSFAFQRSCPFNFPQGASEMFIEHLSYCICLLRLYGAAGRTIHRKLQLNIPLLF